ncbi:MAG: PAS domain S-box protein [Desulfomonile tiedjei]|uniref:PAS domain S-box protein n=1 Tax=Desulfomonile tiedjei TaxID=2358 RepID=A0A9D6Z4X9_9BACT|nr:PAS domain S-box protein [Desulfomonile tiedjei]
MSKLFKKTLLMMIILFGTIATIVSAYAGWMIYNRIIGEYKSKAIAIAKNIANSSIEVFLSRDASTIQSMVDQLHETEGVAYVLVATQDGKILSHTFAPKVPYEIVRLVQLPRENKEEVVVTNVRPEGYGNFLDVASPILVGVGGYVHVGMDLDGVLLYITNAIVRLHLATFLLFLVSVGVAYVLTNTISRPLTQLTEYANRLTARDFSAEIHIQSTDEIGLLARTMTTMASEIKTRIATLEMAVSEATRELQDTLAYVSAIIENLADGLLVLNTDGKVTRSNSALTNILGLNFDPEGHSARELLGKKAEAYLLEKGWELANFYSRRAHEDEFTSGEAIGQDVPPDNTSEFTTTRTDGQVLRIELSVSVVNMKGAWNTIGILRDVTVRRKAEEALRVSEEKYRGIFEHAVAGMFQTDDRGHPISANPALARILGYGSTEEFIETTTEAAERLYVDLRDKEEFMRLMQGGQVVHGFELELYRKDGSSIWASIRAGAITNENKKLVFTEGMIEDISERKRAQEALLESEGRYRELFEVSPDPMIVHKDGIILFANIAAAEFLRVSRPQELCGRRVLEFVHPEFSKEVLERTSRAEKEGRSSPFAEVQFIRSDASVGYLQSVAVPTRYMGQSAVLTVGRDITERKEAEEALRSSEQRFRTIFEIAPDCIFLKDQDLNYTHVNPAVESLFGIPASEIIGKKAEDFFGDEAGRHICEGDLRVLTGQTIEGEHTRPVRGMYLTFHDIRTPLRNSVGEVMGICKFSRNITDRKGIQQSPQAKEREYKSAAMLATVEQALHAAKTDGIVVLLGESGSGKDFIARWIHSKSERADGPFFSVNCAAIPRELAESEFFGHERGAFTGALARKKGLLELAEGGTLLLNEVGELPLSLQTKLLTFLDTRSFTRVGGEKMIRVSARLIAATHRDLLLEIAEGRFLEALYYRLSVFVVRVPPLRERIEDMPTIAEDMLLRLATEMRLTQVPVIDPNDMKRLCSYHWPGNVRELRNILERAVMLSKGPKISVEVPALDTRKNEWVYEVRFQDRQNLPQTINDLTRTLCTEALRRSEGNKKEAAQILGISRHSLYRFLKNSGFYSENELW